MDLRVPGQPGLHRETLSREKQRQNKTTTKPVKKETKNKTIKIPRGEILTFKNGEEPELYFMLPELRQRSLAECNLIDKSR